MIPYIILLFIPLFLDLAQTRKSKNKYNIAILFYFFAFFLVLSLRSVNIGTDLSGYEAKFNTILKGSWNQIPDIVREVGYGYLNKLVAYITDDFQLFITIIAAVTVIPLYFLYRNPNKWNYLKIVIFMNMATFSMMFSGLRQAITISIGVCAYFALTKKKFWQFLILVFVAFFIHHSSIILILLYPLSKINLKEKYLIFLVPIFIVFFIFKTQIAAVVIFALASSDELAIYSERYSDFSDTGAYGTLLLFIIFTFISYFLSDSKKMNEGDFFLRNILVTATFLQMVALINPVLMRINYYFIAFVPIAFPISLIKSKVEYRQIASAVGIGMCILLTYYYINRAFWGEDIANVYPYEAFWEIP